MTCDAFNVFDVRAANKSVCFIFCYLFSFFKKITQSVYAPLGEKESKFCGKTQPQRTIRSNSWYLENSFLKGVYKIT